MNIAIIGSGISGLVAAYHLSTEHQITLFEANDYVGGHTHTHKISLNQREYAIDTGFIVFNDWTYPNFIRLMEELGVQSQPSHMSFSVKCEKTGLEYNGTTLNALFAQRLNLVRPSFLRMVADVLRFNREASQWLSESNEDISLGEYLAANRYSKAFIEHYIVPMGSAIWSADPLSLFAFPAQYFLRFFHNHGMLSVDNRPVWRVIQGGSQSYIAPLTRRFAQNIRLHTSIASVQRQPHQVRIKPVGGDFEHFDAVIFACHSDQALALLADASAEEREILGAIPYQENEAVLHTDARILPKRKLAWAAWNYHIPRDHQNKVAITYDMNILQSLDAPETFCVTLNHSDNIDPARIIQRISYHHPVFTPAGIIAQGRHDAISGFNRTFYCGAYWGFGFHEDGVNSALKVVRQIKEQHTHAQLPLRRTG